MKPRILYAKPSISELEARYATDAAANGWGEQCYAYINRFEALFKAHLGVRYAVATSSCTGALHMGMAALGIGPGDEVIMADTNWIATASPIVHLGATPVFVDVLGDTWCIDPDMWHGEKRREVMNKLNPSVDCPMHCIRHESNLFLEKMISGGFAMDPSEVVNDYDRFI